MVVVNIHGWNPGVTFASLLFSSNLLSSTTCCAQDGSSSVSPPLHSYDPCQSPALSDPLTYTNSFQAGSSPPKILLCPSNPPSHCFTPVGSLLVHRLLGALHGRLSRAQVPPQQLLMVLCIGFQPCSWAPPGHGSSLSEPCGDRPPFHAPVQAAPFSQSALPWSPQVPSCPAAKIHSFLANLPIVLPWEHTCPSSALLCLFILLLYDFYKYFLGDHKLPEGRV